MAHQLSALDEQYSVDLRQRLVDQGELSDPRTPKGALVQAATRLFRQRGYERTTVRELAKAVGILPGSIFHHFRSKDEILQTVMREGITLTLARMRAALEHANTPEARLRALIYWELWALNGETGEAMVSLIHEWRSLSPEGQDAILALRDIYEKQWLDVLGEAREGGLTDTDSFILRRLLAGALNWTVNWFKPEGGEMSIEDLTDEVLHLVTRNRRSTDQSLSGS